MRAGIHGLARHGGRVLAALVVGPQALRQRAGFARRGDRLVVVVLVVRHRHFDGTCAAGSAGGGAVLGDVVSLTAGAWLVDSPAGADCDVSGWGTVSAGDCAGACCAGIAGVAEAPELM
jgi:hypothetical protein